MLRRSRTLPGILMLAAAASAVCGVCVHPRAFMMLSGLVAVLALGLVWPAMNVAGLSGVVVFDRKRTREGESAKLMLTIRNRGFWPVWGLGIVARGDGEDSVVQEWPTVHLEGVRGRQTRELEREFTPTMRGEYPLDQVVVESGFPFGLWLARRRLEIGGRLLVWPRMYRVARAPEEWTAQSMLGTFETQRVGTDGDILGVRPYRRGDSHRRIHWPQTARHDRLIVCERQAAGQLSLQLVLDVNPRVHAGQGQGSSREWAIRVAASFCAAWCAEGVLIEAVLGPNEKADLDGRNHVDRWLDTLARLPNGERPALEAVLDAPVCRRFRGSMRIVITSDEAVSATPVRVLQIPRQQFVVLGLAGFAADRGVPERLPVRPWLSLRCAAEIPGRLRSLREAPYVA